MLILPLKDNPGRDLIEGQCANCKKQVYEHLFTLDDAYNVWAGECPHCKAINLLATTSLRGYSSQGMDLVLPFDEEVEANSELPRDCPTAGKAGYEPNIKGSALSEFTRPLIEGTSDTKEAPDAD